MCLEFQLRAFQSEIVIVWKDKCALLFLLPLQSSAVGWGLLSGSVKCKKGLFGCSEVSLPVLSFSLECEIAKAFYSTYSPIPSYHRMAMEAVGGDLTQC